MDSFIFILIGLNIVFHVGIQTVKWRPVCRRRHLRMGIMTKCTPSKFSKRSIGIQCQVASLRKRKRLMDSTTDNVRVKATKTATWDTLDTVIEETSDNCLFEEIRYVKLLEGYIKQGELAAGHSNSSFTFQSQSFIRL